jgi:NADH:ubiquinone oxidoreductase subunit E
VSGSGLPRAEAIGHRKHGRRQEEVPQELRDQVKRFGAGSRVPGWDDAVDLDKNPQEIPDLATTEVPDELRTAVESSMAKYPDRRSAAIPCLAAAQRLHGWCSPEAIRQVAAVMRLTPAYLVSVATFYDMLDTRPIGRHRVYVCTNISCSLNGGRQLLDRVRAQVGEDDDIQVRGFECLGACDIAPMLSADGVYVGPVDLDDVPELVEQIKGGKPVLPAKQIAVRPTVDPNAGMPGAPTSAGPEMAGDQLGPTAPLEQAPDPPEGPGEGGN